MKGRHKTCELSIFLPCLWKKVPLQTCWLQSINVSNFGWPHPSHGFGPPELRKSWYHARRGTIWIGWLRSSDEVTAHLCAQYECNVRTEAGTNETLSVDIVAIGESERNWKEKIRLICCILVCSVSVRWCGTVCLRCCHSEIQSRYTAEFNSKVVVVVPPRPCGHKLNSWHCYGLYQTHHQTFHSVSISRTLCFSLWPDIETTAGLWQVKGTETTAPRALVHMKLPWAFQLQDVSPMDIWIRAWECFS